EITDNIDFETPGLYLVQYRSRDEAGHETIAFRNLFIKDDDYIAIPDFKATAISQFTIRLSWTAVNHLGVSIQRRQTDSSVWSTLAENVFDSVYDDTTVEPFVDYYYRLILSDGTSLTAEDTAWTVRAVHYSTVIQPISISAIETTVKQKWSVVTQFVRTWTSLTEINV
ncbi:MAG: hypothetical protein PHQ75_12480, partial [Thermoguttaceae bacterium]|nr:hypothetical protein [Thermoguttaceae bacterium]